MATNRNTQADIDWTNWTKETHRFENRLQDAYMGKALHADMSFYVESDRETIPAHSLIIAAASEVLERLIYGSGTLVNDDRLVTVPNCPLNEFNVLLRYLYTGESS